MSNFEDETRDLRHRTKQLRREFLSTELQTCFLALDRGRLELSMGNSDEVRKEIAIATRGAEVIQHFLRQAPGQLREIEAKLPNLSASIESLRLELEKTPR